MTAQVRWGVLGTANIAAHAFLPAMRAAGGVATAVGSRDPERSAAWASDNEVGRATTYGNVLAADDVDAVYIAVPNDQHVEWAARAAATGKAVVCEKPLGLNLAEVDDLLDRAGDALLWEAFVFPFHPQTALLRRLCSPGGPIGGAREIISEFHFRVTRPDNIRWQAAQGGGALLDVGCYPIRLARLLFDADAAVRVAATSATTPDGVDAEFAAVLDFPGEQRLLFSVGMRRCPSTYTRILGDTGELRVSNPFHPTDGDTVELWQDGERSEVWAADRAPAFQHAAQHVADVVRGATRPRHLASTDARGNAATLDMARAAVPA
jgi:xylose dehydrogenase (NAD/NADP)